ncbi:DinB family protein [Salegentibacter chungangensis]|uniref:DinB family protein n=1 Tax=Salegentibacter chungangensis TaxID=1335724 RepID=A0ABW3NQR4_9FLAO
MEKEKKLREQLVKHLKGGEAFNPIDDFLEDMPFEKLGIRPDGLPYSFYEVFYHIVFAQKDILEFSIAGSYTTSTWPDDYWPKEQQPKNEEDWERLKKEYFDDRLELEEFLLDLNNGLLEPVKNAEHQSLFREVMLVVEHTAYHSGQLLIIQRLLGLRK